MIHVKRTAIGIGLALVVVLGLLVLGLSRCKTYTYWGRVELYPHPESGKPAKYTLNVAVNGERGKAYVAFTRKHIYLRVKSKGNELLFREYEVVAADLGFVTDWIDDYNFRVVFYDSEDGNTLSSEVEKASGFRPIIALCFQYDMKEGKFVEAPIDAATLELVKTHPALR